MDNNFNGNMNNQISGQETEGTSGFSLKNDNVQPQADFQTGYVQQQADSAQYGTNPQTGYVQQQADFSQYGANPQAGYVQPGVPSGGMGGSAGSGRPPKVKKPMTTGKLAAIIGGSIALVALIVCGVIFLPKLFKSDKEVVIEAFENAFDIDTESSDKDDILGIDEMQAAFQDKGGSNYMVMTIDELAGEKLDLSMSIEQSFDQVNKLANQIISAAYQDKDFLTANIFANETTVYINIADMFDGYIALPSEGTAEALENSPIGQYMEGSTMAFGDLNYFGSSDDDGNMEIYGGYVDAIEQLWDSVLVEKQGKAKINVNDKTITAKEYYVTFSEKDIEEAICSALDGASQAVAADSAALEEAGMDIDTYNAYMEQIKNFVPSIVTEDLVIKVYVKDKKAVKITSAADLSILTVAFGYDFCFDMYDNDVSGAFTLSVAGEEVGIKFTANDIDDMPNGTFTAYMPENVIDVSFKTTENSDKAFKLEADAKYNAETVCNINFSHETNDDNTFKGVFNCHILDDGVMDITYEGGLKDIEKGVKYTAYVDKIEMNVDGEKFVGASCEFAIDTSSVSVQEMDSSLPVYDLVNMTDTDLENFILDNQDNFEAWMKNFTENAGIIGDLFLIGSYEEDIDGIESENEEASGADANTASEDDKILVSGDVKVKILGCIDGFEPDYSCEYFIDFSTQNYSYLEYSIFVNTTMDYVMEDMYLPSEDTKVYSKVENQDIALGNDTLKYSMIQFESTVSEEKVSRYRIAKEIADGTFLVVDAEIYDEDDSYTIDQLVKALDSQYYEILAK